MTRLVIASIPDKKAWMHCPGKVKIFNKHFSNKLLFYLELGKLSTGAVCFFTYFCHEIQIHIDRMVKITV
ncbi:hypothetical protein BRW84_01095 [Oxalobacter formigenes OXCC13]|nr:hypothetical protein BRW84_01095 [Oxalobacter formigenes OXCC13]